MFIEVRSSSRHEWSGSTHEPEAAGAIFDSQFFSARSCFLTPRCYISVAKRLPPRSLRHPPGHPIIEPPLPNTLPLHVRLTLPWRCPSASRSSDCLDDYWPTGGFGTGNRLIFDGILRWRSLGGRGTGQWWRRISARPLRIQQL